MYKQSSPVQVEFYTKIQEATPSHLSTLLNKQVGYLVHVQSDKLYKLKNCIDSARSNSELYKKISKKFSANLKKNTNQIIVCCGLQQKARIQTSIGLKKNPGIFMIAGIGVLDEKYQLDHKSYDVEISFIEYNQGKFYDLLRYTNEPLKIYKKSEDISFGEAYFKIATFSQFLKLFKIALFNNKQRDFKTDCNNQYNKIKSTFIMTILTKKYTNGKVKVQKTSLVDFSMQEPVFGQKSQWENFAIQLNNMTGRKKQHYHLVEPNPLLSFINYYLKSGEVFILNSMSANPHKFQKNYQFICQYENLVAQIPTQKYDDYANKCNSDNSSEQSINQQLVQSLQSITSLLINKKYSSLRQYREFKENILNILAISQNCHTNCLRFIVKLLQNKRKIKLSEHFIIADQLRLIGSCVKTDHYKDFYRAKSYLSLERQVLIKTEQTKAILNSLLKEKENLKQKFHECRNKFLEEISCFGGIRNSEENFNKNLTQNNLCSTINTFSVSQKTGNNLVTEDINQIMRIVVKKINQLQSRIFNNIIFSCKRTNADQIIRQQQLIDQAKLLEQQIQRVKSELNGLARTNKIEFKLQSNIQDAHLVVLIREMKNLAKNEDRKNQQKQTKCKSKQNNINRGNSIKMDQLGIKSAIQLNKITKFTKLPLIQKQNICIAGQISLKDMLLDPNQL